MKTRGKVLFFVAAFIAIFALLFLNVGKATPDNQPFYNTKRLYEKAQLKLASSPAEEVDVFSQLLDKRLSELEFIVMSGKSKHVLKTSLRYSTFAGQLTETALQNNLVEKVPEIKDKLELHRQVVRRLVEDYPRQDDEKKFVIDAVNYLTIYIEQLSSFGE